MTKSGNMACESEARIAARQYGDILKALLVKLLPSDNCWIDINTCESRILHTEFSGERATIADVWAVMSSGLHLHISGCPETSMIALHIDDSNIPQYAECYHNLNDPDSMGKLKQHITYLARLNRMSILGSAMRQKDRDEFSR